MAANENQTITLASYESSVPQYTEGTPSEPSDELKDFMQKFLDFSPAPAAKDTEIMEIGSAVGRDADFIEGLGYKVERTDVVLEFLEHQQEKGSEASFFDALTSMRGKQYDVIYAMAVFHHFNHEQFLKAINNVHLHLKDNGVFAMAIKRGVGESYSEHKIGKPRYYLRWTEEQLIEVFGQNNFVVQDIVPAIHKEWNMCIVTKA